MTSLQPAKDQMQIIVKKSGLESTKANYLLNKFQDYFKIADEWEKRAKTIVVTNESQKVEMQLARTGRLFLRDKRIAIEKARKELKEQALREGKAIDGIANILKALIVPIEEYLERQEKYVEIKAKEAEEKRRLEAERKAEEERIAKERAEREEQERIRIENEKLKKEAEERERAMRAERAKAEVEKRAIEEKARKEKEEAERVARIEREKQEKILAKQRAKAEAERKAIEEKAKLERKKMQKKLEEQIECPFCHKKFTLPQSKRRQAMTKVEKLKHCSNCTENFYNGNNSYGIKECWHLKTAKLVLKKQVHINQRPPWKQKPIKVLSCFRMKNYVFVNPKVEY